MKFRKGDEEGAEVRVMGPGLKGTRPRAREYGEPLQGGKDKEADSPLSLWFPAYTLILTLRGSGWNFDLQNYR